MGASASSDLVRANLRPTPSTLRDSPRLTVPNRRRRVLGLGRVATRLRAALRPNQHPSSEADSMTTCRYDGETERFSECDGHHRCVCDSRMGARIMGIEMYRESVDGWRHVIGTRETLRHDAWERYQTERRVQAWIVGACTVAAVLLVMVVAL